MVEGAGRVAERFERMAVHFERGGSPAYARIARGLARDRVLLELVMSVPEGNKRQPNLWLGAVRFLGGPVDSFEAFRGWVLERSEAVVEVVLSRSTQTNEARRCATLLPVLAGLEGPLALIEVGASAGLCLYPDRYRYRFDGGKPVGPVESPVVLECATSGGVPIPERVPEVVWRAGIDMNPLDPADEGDVDWLAALVWPGEGERERVARLRAAASVAAREPAWMVAGDLLEELPGVVERVPAGVRPVVLHSAVLAYLSRVDRVRFEGLVRGLDVTWVSNESGAVFPEWEGAFGGVDTDFAVAVDGRVVAYAGEHGGSLAWR